MTHLIDKRRLSPQYLHRVFVEGTYSSYIVRHLHGGVALPWRGPVSFVIDSLKRTVKACLDQPWSPALTATREAERRAVRDIRRLQRKRKIEIRRLQGTETFYDD